MTTADVNRARFVTAAEFAEWEAAARAGESAAQIAKRFRRCRTRVSKHLNAMGVPRLVNAHLPRDHVALVSEAKKLKADGLTRKEIAAKLGVSTGVLGDYLSKTGTRLWRQAKPGPALADAACKLKVANPRMTRAEIAAQLGVKWESLKWYLRKAGVRLSDIRIPKGNGPGNKGMARLDHSAGVQARPPTRAKQQPRAGGDVSRYLPHHAAGTTSFTADEAAAIAAFVATRGITRIEQGEFPDVARHHGRRAFAFGRGGKRGGEASRGDAVGRRLGPS